MKITFVMGILLLFAAHGHASWKTVQPESRPEMAFAVSDKTANAGQSTAGPDVAVLGVGCESDGHQWVYVRLSDAVALPGKAVQGQLNWGNAVSYDAPFSYHSESRTLYLEAGVEDAVSLLQGSEFVTVSINWTGAQKSTFKFALDGSRSAIKNAFSRCGSSST
jgi:hypothetical protein